MHTDIRADRQTDKCKSEKKNDGNKLYSKFLTRPESNKTVQPQKMSHDYTLIVLSINTDWLHSFLIFM